MNAQIITVIEPKITDVIYLIETKIANEFVEFLVEVDLIDRMTPTMIDEHHQELLLTDLTIAERKLIDVTLDKLRK